MTLFKIRTPRPQDKKIIDKLDSSLTLIGVTTDNKMVLTCTNCGPCTEWEPAWLPAVKRVYDPNVTVIKCVSCSKSFPRSDEKYQNEIIEELNQYCDSNTEVVRIIDLPITAKSRVVLRHFCQHNKPTDEWGNPRLLTVNQMRTERHQPIGCIRCSGHYVRSDSEWMEELKPKLVENLSIKQICDGKVIFNCPVHGDSDKFGIPWVDKASELLLKATISCRNCNTDLKLTEEERLASLNKNAPKKARVVKTFIEDGKRRVVTNCDEHGLSTEWANPTTPTADEAKKSRYKCNKCAGNYSRTKEEAIEYVNSMMVPQLTCIEVPDYTNLSTSVAHVRCDFHGDMWLHNKPWLPKLNKLLYAQGCPICAKNGQNLTELLNATIEEQNSPHYIYSVRFDHIKGSFYKIGITAFSDILKRFREINQNKDGVCLRDVELFRTTKLGAALAEAWALVNFATHRINRQNVLVACGGGTECFDTPIHSLMPLSTIAKNAQDNKDALIEHFYNKEYIKRHREKKPRSKLKKPGKSNKLPAWDKTEFLAALAEYKYCITPLAKAYDVDKMTVKREVSHFDLTDKVKQLRDCATNDDITPIKSQYLELCKNENTRPQIMRELDLTTHQILKLEKLTGIAARNGRESQIEHDHGDTIVEMTKSNYHAHHIAVALGLSVDSVRDIAHKKGIKALSKNEARKRSLLPKVKEMASKGYLKHQISKALNIDPATLGKWAIEEKISFQTRKGNAS